MTEDEAIALIDTIIDEEIAKAEQRGDETIVEAEVLAAARARIKAALTTEEVVSTLMADRVTTGQDSPGDVIASLLNPTPPSYRRWRRPDEQ